MAGALSVLQWTSKNPELYDFLYSAYGITKYEMLSNLPERFSKVISYGLVVLDTAFDIVGHISNGDSWQTYTASGAVTAGTGYLNVWASTKAGAYIGGLVGGGVGLIIGVAAGVVIGILINGVFYTEINGNSIAGYLEDGIETILRWLS